MVALLGTTQYPGATHTSATSLPLPLNSLCPWDYSPVYIGILLYYIYRIGLQLGRIYVYTRLDIYIRIRRV